MLENPIYRHTNAHYITHNPALRCEAVIPPMVLPVWCYTAEVEHKNLRRGVEDYEAVTDQSVQKVRQAGARHGMEHQHPLDPCDLIY